MPAKKILFLVGDFAEDYEVMVRYQALKMVGHVVQPARICAFALVGYWHFCDLLAPTAKVRC